MSHSPLRLRAGDLVEVRSESEILATLDENGALDGLPFMPEMLAFCGQHLRVDSRADKTCDTINYSGSRRLHDAVHLGGARCDGQAHGGCQAQCLLFWKEAWLRRVSGARGAAGHHGPVERGPEPSGRGGCHREQLSRATRRIEPSDPGGEPRYRCQATDLLLASSPLAWWDPRQYLRDVWSGNVRVRVLVGAALFRIFLALLHRGHGYRALMSAYTRLQSRRGWTPFPYKFGDLDKTPRATLELQPGELVRVKSQDEILLTVNKRNRNHGLSFDPEMVRYCGGVYRVLARAERIVEERTGKMLTLSKDCIILDGVVCRAEYSHKRLFCPRSLYPFWREIWLERVDGAEATMPDTAADHGCLAGSRRGPCERSR